jgi:hypothetical protein
VAAVLTADQFANLGQNTVLRAVGGQTSLDASTGTADASLDGVSANLNTTLFVADYRDNPQVGTTVAGVSYYDIRETNATDGATLTVTFRFAAGSGIPNLEYFDPSVGTYVAVSGVTETAPVFIGQGMEAITITFTSTSFPKISDLNGTVFTIVIAPVTTSAQSTLSPALALADIQGAGMTVSREVSFQGSGVTVGLSPSQDATRAVSRADLGGGGGDDLDEVDPADMDAILNALGFAPVETTPIVAPTPIAPVAAPQATPANGQGVSGPGAALPIVFPADAVFAAAVDTPFAFRWQPVAPERLAAAASAERLPANPSLLAVPLLGTLATRPLADSSNKRRRALDAYFVERSA